eukprot:gnl/TRDRNA2_/TRDRNA2_66389_c0_seq1.p1 gnl/TRDRNA2_/TRDRNA2_66389_c0~~gnl/TRDRNA2_/TRDRNA2_66389_c0_seq1.p1  ORF type:complete len:123 (+),score=3.97 gnl/TRDRNA2_/TRDRNA2_66389_c0_seq1:42-371(+)
MKEHAVTFHKHQQHGGIPCLSFGCSFVASDSKIAKDHRLTHSSRILIPCGISGCLLTFSDEGALARHKLHRHHVNSANVPTLRQSGVPVAQRAAAVTSIETLPIVCAKP